MGLCFGCFDGGNKRMTKEEERLASEEARARAAEAAQKKCFFLSFTISSLCLYIALILANVSCIYLGFYLIIKTLRSSCMHACGN